MALKATIKINLWLVFPIAGVLSIASPVIMGLYGSRFKTGWSTLIAVLIATVIMAAILPANQVFAALGKMWIGLGLNVAWAAFLIIGSVILLERGAFGLAMARAGSYLLHSVLVFATIIYLMKNEKSKRYSDTEL
jgi:O-antigen/teichoic acid export membrane protein